MPKTIQEIPSGNIYIQSTYNNIIISLTDEKGNVKAFSSSGRLGFKGPRKSTAYAASLVAKDVLQKAASFGFKEARVFVRGVGAGRESAIRALNVQGVHILSVKDVTPIPHNGCRPKKPRRI
jgi:small subunit ribosomal protein S11